jgi:hypothetical protein
MDVDDPQRRRATPAGSALLDRHQRLTSHSGEGLNFSFHGARMGGELAMLKRVSVSSRSSTSGAVHPTDRIAPNRGCLAL